MRELKNFYDIGQEYLIWIIQYNSSTFTEPVFMVWYTDSGENPIDRFLTYKSGEIIGFRVLAEVKTIIQDQYANLIFLEKLHNWLNAFETGTEEIDCVFDVGLIEAALEKEDVNSETLKFLIDFINLVGDLGYQEPENDYLLDYAYLDTIASVYDYFYDRIFWPNVWKREKEKIYVRPALEVDNPFLLQDFKEMRVDFEEYIRKA